MYHTKNEILSFLKQLKPELASQGIISLGLFGSMAKETNNEASDIDIIYETSDFFLEKHKGWSAFTYLNTQLRNKVENHFQAHVDMFDLNSASPFKDKVKKEAFYV